jgi:hypothetical protein
LKRATPIGWTEKRVEEYFVWAKKVTDGCKGVDEKMESILADLYAEKIQDL